MDDNSKAYELPAKSIPGLNLSHHVSDIIEIKKFLEARGILTQNTRVERYIQYLTECMNEGGPKKESLIFKNAVDERFKTSTDWLLYVLREVHELMWILKGFKVHIPEGLNERLELLVGGSDFAALDINPHSRNVQFELRIASYFCQCGCIVDLSTETDMIAVTDEFAFFIECKRIGSVSQFHRRLAEAANQLKRRMPKSFKNRIPYGCVAADVTKVAFDHNGLTWALTPEHSRDINQNKLRSIANTPSRFPVFSGCQNVIQYWLQIHIPCLISHPPITITRFSSYYIENFYAGGKSIAALKFLRDVASVANTPDEREIPAHKLIRRTQLTLPPGTAFRVVEQNILRELIESGRVAGKQDHDIVAVLEFDGIKHEFNLYDLRALAVSISKSEMESLAKNEVESGLELVLKMYMRRYPYENTSTPASKPNVSDNQGATSM